MTLFGDKELFAVEFSPIVGHPEGPGVCNFTYWIDGQPIGNWEFEAPILEVIEDLKSILLGHDYYRDDELFKETTRQLVERYLSGDIEEPVKEGGPYDLLRRHSISYYMGHGYPVDVGHRWNIFLIENDKCGRILYFENPEEGPFYSKVVPVGYVCHILRVAFNEMNDWYDVIIGA